MIDYFKDIIRQYRARRHGKPFPCGCSVTFGGSVVSATSTGWRVRCRTHRNLQAAAAMQKRRMGDETRT